MDEIREGFHTLANHLNNISINAGIIVETIKMEDIDGMLEKEAKEEFKKALKALSQAVDSALQAGEIASTLKKRIYRELKIDTG